MAEAPVDHTRLDSTEAYSSRFAAAWPPVARRLRLALRLRGVDPHLIDDVLQDTALRAVAHSIPFTSSGDLYAWARTVAIRLCIAEFRRTNRIAFEVPDTAVDHDLASAVESRQRLADVWRRADLSPKERQALFFELYGRPTWAASHWGPWKARLTRVRDKLRETGATVAALLRQWWQYGDVPTAVAAAVSLVISTVALGLPSSASPLYEPAGSSASQPTATQVPAQSTEHSGQAARDMPARGQSSDGHAHLHPTTERIDTGAGPAGRVLFQAPAVVDGAEGRVTKNDDDEADDLHFCTKDFPVVGTGCPISLDPTDPASELNAFPDDGAG